MYFPLHFILPIILVVYFYPERGVLFSLGLGLMYISLIYLLGNSDPTQIAIATAWFAIFITIGVVASSYAIRLAGRTDPGQKDPGQFPGRNFLF